MFGVKKFPHNEGYPTPESTPAGRTCLTLQIPANSAWWAVYIGLLYTLTSEWSWQQMEGGMSKEDAAIEAQTILDDALALAETNVCGTMVEAPYWDDTTGDDADDEAPANDQPWYGVWDGETFVESISYWAVTAFLATGVSEGAAISFITPLRKFRLLLKANPHGAKVLILMDSNIFQLVDLFSATDEVVSVDIASPGSTLMLVHSGEHNPSATPDENGNYVVDVIKKELTEAEVTPPNQRVNEDTGVYQISPDNGTTWNDAPQSDPRTSPAYLLPHLTPYSGIECDVATRMTAQLKDTLDIFIASGDAAQAVTGWLALLVFPLGVVGWVFDVLLAIANLLIDNGQAAIEAAFTTEVYDSVRCSFQCFIDANGQITQSGLDQAYDEIKANNPGLVATVIDELRFFFGDVPMNNAGVIRDETGTCDDCPDCTWCHLFDASSGWTGATSLLWVSGTGTAASFDGTRWTNGLSGDGRARLIALKFSGAAAKHFLQFIALGDVPNWHFKRDCTGDDYVNTGTEFTPTSSSLIGTSWDAPAGKVLVSDAVYVYRYTVDVSGAFHLDSLKMMGQDGTAPYDENCP